MKVTIGEAIKTYPFLGKRGTYLFLVSRYAAIGLDVEATYKEVTFTPDDFTPVAGAVTLEND